MRFNKIFQNGCVIQRGKKVPIWGEAPTGRKITLTFAGQTKTTFSVDNKWYVELDPLEVERNLTMIADDGEETIKLQHISVGDVWLAAGQSNMEMWMHYDKEFAGLNEQDLKNLDIHFYDCAKVSYSEEYDDWDFSKYEIWRGPDKEDIEYYSAVGFWFAKYIQSELDIPIGIIGCNYGGSNACCWLDQETVQKHGGPWLESYANAVKKLDIEKYTQEFRKNPFNGVHANPLSEINEMLINADDQEAIGNYFRNVKIPPMGPLDAWRPCGLYKTMLSQIIPYSVKGILWYQGESDDVHAEIYEAILTDLIALWRRKWNEELPFFIVQLAPFENMNGGMSGENYPIIREAQAMVTKKIDKTWLISTSDCGEQFDIHPKRKRKVGERLAMQALHYVYHKNILSDAPECIRCFAQGRTVILEFFNAGEGLRLDDENMDWMEIRQAGRTLSFSLRKIENCKMFLNVPDLEPEQKFSVEIAQKAYYCIGLYNSADFPVIPGIVLSETQM